MADKLDEEVGADSWFVKEIKENAKCPKNAELVIQSITALTGNRFNPDDIIEIASSPAPNDVLAKVIHDSAKFLRAGIDKVTIIQIAKKATHTSEVSNILKLAVDVKEMTSAYEKDDVSRTELNAANEKLIRALDNLNTVAEQSSAPDTAAAIATISRQQSPTL